MYRYSISISNSFLVETVMWMLGGEGGGTVGYREPPVTSTLRPLRVYGILLISATPSVLFFWIDTDES